MAARKKKKGGSKGSGENPSAPTPGPLTFDVNRIRSLARGRWPSILAHVAGINPDLCDEAHHPCPRCGGTDRWRFTNMDGDGSSLCNNCGKFGDGFATAEHLTGKKFAQVLELVAGDLGVEGTPFQANGHAANGHSGGRGKWKGVDPAKDLKFQPWNDFFAARFCQEKLGVTTAAIQAVGGQIARYRDKFTVIALPVWGKDWAEIATAKPVGWVIYNHNGGTLPKWSPTGNKKPDGKSEFKVEEVKVKVTWGSQAGIIADRARLVASGVAVVWKMEGPSDLLSFLSMDLPADVAAFTTANGAGERPQPWMLDLASGRKSLALHDADNPGEAGAATWASYLASTATTSQQVTLPYPIAETKGKDFRDWKNEAAEGSPRTYADLLLLPQSKPFQPPDELLAEESDSSRPEPVSNFHSDLDDDGNEVRVPLAMSAVILRITEKTDNWPRRVGSALFVHDASGIHWLENCPALFGWLATRVGVVEWIRQTGCVSKEEVFHELARTATNYEAVESLPHFPPLPGHYYACEEIPPGDGEHLSRLVEFFSPATPADTMLILSMFVTPFWGGNHGSRPAFLVTSDDGRGVGKSKITDMLSLLAGGHVELSATEDAGRMRSRLLSPEGLRKRIGRLDNVKSLKFSWPEFESIVTSPIISGHRLHRGEGARPNNLLWLITLNGASLSTDMSQRVITIKLKKPHRIGAWESDVVEFINEHRQQIIADVAFFMTIQPEPIPNHTRWALWEDQILARLEDPIGVQNMVASRSESSDVETEEIELIEEFFYRRLWKLGYGDSDKIHVPSGIAGRWFSECTRDQKTVISACRVLSQYCNEGRTKKIFPNSSKTYGRGFSFCMSDSASGFDASYELEKKISQFYASKDENEEF